MDKPLNAVLTRCIFIDEEEVKRLRTAGLDDQQIVDTITKSQYPESGAMMEEGG